MVARFCADGTRRLSIVRTAIGYAPSTAPCRQKSAMATGALAGLAYWARPEGLGVALVGIGIGTAMIAATR